MDVDEQSVGAFLGTIGIGATALVGLLAYLGRRLLDSLLGRGLEKYKGDLQREADQYKAELQRLTTEHSIKFQRLHGDRADAAVEIYSRLVALDGALSSALRSFQHAGDKPLDEKLSEVAKLHNELREYYLPRAIYLSKKNCAKIDEIIEYFKDIFFDVTSYTIDPTAAEYQQNRELLLERFHVWEKARSTYRNQFVSARSGLAQAFRELLGLKDD